MLRPEDFHLPTGFAISDKARDGLERLKSQIAASSPDDPPAFVSVGWVWKPGGNPDEGNVAIGFYARSQQSEVAGAVRAASGVDLIFLVQAEHRHYFEGAILDGEPEGGFFLRKT